MLLQQPKLKVHMQKLSAHLAVVEEDAALCSDGSTVLLETKAEGGFVSGSSCS